MGGLSALAWLTLWLWGQSPYGRLLNHDELSGADLSNGLVVLVIVVGCRPLMVVAMMLPTSLPLVALFHRLTRQRPGSRVAGVAAARWVSQHVDSLWHGSPPRRWTPARGRGTEPPGCRPHAWAMGAGILMLAGLYQFMPLKYACLDKCRSPLSFLTEHWRGSHKQQRLFGWGCVTASSVSGAAGR